MMVDQITHDAAGVLFTQLFHPMPWGSNVSPEVRE
jgi:hypothetical protein